MASNTTNCATCEVLVYQIDVPSKKTGNCWRCEVKRLREENSELSAKLKDQVFKVVECQFEAQSIQVECGAVMKGPIKGVLLVVVPNDQLHTLMIHDGAEAFIQATEESIKAAGWDGEVLVVSDTMKMARFESVCKREVCD